MFCKNCGTEVSDRAISCPKCGEPFAPQHLSRVSYELKEPKKRSEAWVLWIFVGFFGAHCFYLERYWRAIGHIGFILASLIVGIAISWWACLVVLVLKFLFSIHDAMKINKWVNECNNTGR